MLQYRYIVCVAIIVGKKKLFMIEYQQIAIKCSDIMLDFYFNIFRVTETCTRMLIEEKNALEEQPLF